MTAPAVAGRSRVQGMKVDDQVRFVTNGRGSMPAFGDRLTDAQIRLVVKYTRTL